MGCTAAGDREREVAEKVASTWSTRIPLKVRLPNSKDRDPFSPSGLPDDWRSDARCEPDHRSVTFGGPGHPLHLSLSIDVKRSTTKTTLRKGGEADVFEYSTKASFEVADISPGGVLGDRELVHEVLGWPVEEELKQVQLLNLGGEHLCYVDCSRTTRIASVKECMARSIGIPSQAQSIFVLDDATLQVVVVLDGLHQRRTMPIFNVEYDMDTDLQATQLSRINDGENAWDVSPISRWGQRSKAITVSKTDAETYRIVGRPWKAKDRRPRTALMRLGRDGNFCAYATADFRGADDSAIAFDGELCLDASVANDVACMKPVLVAFGLLLAGADAEKWRKRKEVEWIGVR